MKVTPIRELTIGELKDCFAKERFDFEPIYQRKSGVWRERQRLLLIDSILSGYIIPVVIFRQNKHVDKWEVVDGSQRLYSIKDYLIDG